MTVAITSTTPIAYPHGAFVTGPFRTVVADIVITDFDDGIALTPASFGLAEVKGVAILGISGVADSGVRVAAQYNHVDAKLYPVAVAGSVWNACPVTVRVAVYGL